MMTKGPKIALTIPDSTLPDQYFAFRLKQGIRNEPSEFPRSKRIFVVSDIEGNFLTFCRLLKKGKVIDKYLHWTFEDNRLIILGDCFDRGDQVAECLWLIYSLEEKAREAGGYVHFILGNHEIMNMNGDWRYVHPKYAETTRSQASHTALYNGNHELWSWLRTKNIMEKVGNTLFVHGGISDSLLALRLPIDEINNRVRPYYTRANEAFSDPLLAIVFNSEQSPFWYRGYYQPGMNEELLNATLKQFKVKRIITGHTITEKISTFYNGKLINTDTDHTGSNSEALLIVKHRYYRVPVKGKIGKVNTLE